MAVHSAEHQADLCQAVGHHFTGGWGNPRRPLSRIVLLHPSPAVCWGLPSPEIFRVLPGWPQAPSPPLGGWARTWVLKKPLLAPQSGGFLGQDQAFLRRLHSGQTLHITQQNTQNMGLGKPKLSRAIFKNCCEHQWTSDVHWLVSTKHLWSPGIPDTASQTHLVHAPFYQPSCFVPWVQTALKIGPRCWGFSNTAVDIFFFNFRMARDSPLLERLIKAGYHVEPCCVAPDVTAIVEFPVAAGNSIRTTRDITMWEQLSLAAFMQRYWADNQVCADWVGCSVSAGNFCANNLMIAQQICVGLSISCLFVVWFEFFWPEWTAVCGQKEWLLKSSK